MSKNENILIKSVESGNIKLLKSLVEKAEYSVENQVDAEGNNLLHRAVLAGRKEMIKYISKRCLDLVSQWNDYGLAPVHLALLSNNPGIVEILLMVLKKSDDIKTRDDQLTLVQYMVINSHPSMIKVYFNSFIRSKQLIKMRINECNEEGMTAMHLAAASGFRDVLILLYEGGGDLFKRDCGGMLPFHHALSNGFLFTATLIARLMHKSPNEFINDNLNGSTCLMKSCEKSFDPVCVRSIIRWGGDINVKDSEGNDVFYYASLNPKISKEILEILKINS